ncbi:hypothetical protein I317_00718 [Kwoniella heveanensis CBS 569]|uniref:NmrA-like domain-containing protein n=1 Tax=Kwoniella heveanensis BCC8398 TaxID=1296120 RepID=A0A1B9GZT9_9TREE|nr:hypothetical protein I316_01791 [Kwoniella heveanensis BCC8398]OCF45471.1 hypothetical protein I317_00718 [Kwoniella heveanensis CBS 569]
MAPIVALLGFTGTVGSHLLPELIEQNKQGNIRLIVLYREGSDLNKIPSDVEKREVQLDEAGLEKNKKAIEGVEVVVSSVGAPGILSQNYLVDALAGSPSLKTFIHSDFGTNWTEEELKIPQLKSITVKEDVVAHAKEKGVPLTHIRVGLFDLFFFKFKAAGTDIVDNKVSIYKQALTAPLRLTTLKFLGYAVAQLVTKPDTLPNQTFQVFDLTPTGQDIVDTLTKIHGKPAQIVQYTDEDYHKGITEGFAIGAALQDKWGSDRWGASDRPEIKGWEYKSFEEHVRKALEQ